MISLGVCTNSYPVIKQNMQITFIDIGAGDAIYIETPSGDYILIDAGIASNGGASSSNKYHKTATKKKVM